MKLPIRYRFRNGSGDYLCYFFAKGERVVLGFHRSKSHALTVKDPKAATFLRELCALAGSPVVPDPFKAK